MMHVPMFVWTLFVLLVHVLGGTDAFNTYMDWRYERSAVDINDVLNVGFQYSRHDQDYGICSRGHHDDSLSIAKDPDSDDYVMRVLYKEGTYTKHYDYGKECQSGQKCSRGAGVYLYGHNIPSHTTTLTLYYQVKFSGTFDFNHGGKLPGLWGGSRNCSGGNIGDTCFSTRLMWREGGAGEVYAYVTHDGQKIPYNDYCLKYDHSGTEINHKIHCSDSYGFSIGRGSFKLTSGHHKWYSIRQEIHLNSSPKHSGYIKLWVDDVPKIHVTDIVMRANTNFGIDGVYFSTFFGGNQLKYACPHNTYAYFRNIRITDETKSITHGDLPTQIVG